MEKIGNDSATGDQNQTITQDKQTQYHIKCIVHAYKCKDADCRFRDCQKMKIIVQHCKRCSKRKIIKGCPICKQFLTLCCFHARDCQELGVCSFPFCVNIKNKLSRTHQLRKRWQQAQILRRHIAAMQNRRMSGGLLEPNPQTSNSSSQPSPGAQSHPSPHSQSDTGMKPSTGPPIGALLAVQQVQAAAARQVAQAQIQNPMTHILSGFPSYMGNVGSWGNTGYAQNHQPLHNTQLFPNHHQHQNTQLFPNPQLGLQQPLQIMEGSSFMSTSIDSTMGPPQVMPNPGPSVDDMQSFPQDWQQLFQTLRISSTNSSPPSSSYPEN